MKNYKLILSMAVLLLVAVVASVVLRDPVNVQGSVERGSESQATTTPIAADLTSLCPGKAGGLAADGGVINNVSLTGANLNGGLVIYDATTSNNSLRKSIASTSIQKFSIPVTVSGNATTTAMNWTPDIVFQNGILIDYIGSGTAPTSTVAYKCNAY